MPPSRGGPALSRAGPSLPCPGTPTPARPAAPVPTLLGRERQSWPRSAAASRSATPVAAWSDKLSSVRSSAGRTCGSPPCLTERRQRLSWRRAWAPCGTGQPQPHRAPAASRQRTASPRRAEAATKGQPDERGTPPPGRAASRSGPLVGRPAHPRSHPRRAALPTARRATGGTGPATPMPLAHSARWANGGHQGRRGVGPAFRGCQVPRLGCGSRSCAISLPCTRLCRHPLRPVRSVCRTPRPQRKGPTVFRGPLPRIRLVGLLPCARSGGGGASGPGPNGTPQQRQAHKGDVRWPPMSTAPS